MKPKLHTSFRENVWADEAAEEVLRDIDRSAPFSLALSGGSSPKPVYRALTIIPAEWEKADVFLVDERFVPPEDSESNQKLVRENLQVPANFCFWETGGRLSHQAAADQYDELLRYYERPIDVMILGIGPDGHTASLFPHAPQLAEQNRSAVTAETERFAVKERLTMTFPMILAAKKLVVLMKGASKKSVVQEFLHGQQSTDEFPAKRLLEHDDLHVFFGDF